jgi:hypothetical protein
MKTFKEFVDSVAMIDHGYHRIVPSMLIDHGFDRNIISEGKISDWVQGTGHPSEEIHPELRKSHIDNLSKEECDCIGHYIYGGLYAGHETGSKALNMHLLSEHNIGNPKPASFTIPETSETSEVKYNLPKLDSALSKNKLDRDLTTYSGLGFNPKPKTSDGVTHFPAYISSSPNRAVATKYSKPIDSIRHILKIEHKSGQRGAYIGNDRKITDFHDDEFIMSRHQNLKIDQIPEEHENKHGDKFHIWNAKRL